jgi:uncharacterized protein YbcI
MATYHPAAPTERTSPPLLQISSAVVAAYKHAFGRGPTKARSQFAGPDMLVVSLEDLLTPAERNLVAMGEHARLRGTRLFIQSTLEPKLREIVEEALGRRTLAYVGGIDTNRDLAVELFTLEPRTTNGSGKPPRAD